MYSFHYPLIFKSQPYVCSITAVLWRLLDSHDETDEGCDRCPYCVMFPILNKLNKLCSHVGSLQAEQRYGSNQRGSEEYLQFMKELEFAKVAFPPDVVSRIPGGFIRKDTIMDKHFELSGKLKKLDQLLSTFAKDDSKVLLFSYSTKTLDFIQNYVRSRGFSHLRIDGSVKAKNRQDLCNKFNNDPSIFLFLLSTKGKMSEYDFNVL
jgi:SNF2 family DNA or RNA helicase